MGDGKSQPPYREWPYRDGHLDSSRPLDAEPFAGLVGGCAIFADRRQPSAKVFPAVRASSCPAGFSCHKRGACGMVSGVKFL